MLARTATNAVLRAASKTTAVANDDHNLLRAAARDYRASRAAYDENEIKRKFKVRFGGALLRLRSGQATTGWEPVLPILCRYLRI